MSVAQGDLEGMEQPAPSAGVEGDHGTTPQKTQATAFYDPNVIYQLIILMHWFKDNTRLPPCLHAPYTDVYM